MTARGEGPGVAIPAASAHLLREVADAREAQKKLAPPSPTVLPGLRIEHLVQPSTELSGDLIDFLPLADGSVLFALIDVAGHGVHAAMFTPLMKGMFRALAGADAQIDLDATLRQFTDALMSTHTRTHVAVCMGVVSADRERVRVVGAAQFPPPLLCRAGACDAVDLSGKPLGLFEDAHYAEREIAFPEGGCLVVFSDGVLDLLDGDDDHRLEALRQRLRDAAPATFADVLGALDISPEVHRRDDLACLTIRREAMRSGAAT